MSTNIGDMATMRSLSTTRQVNKDKQTGTTNMSMDDFLQIMVAQFQNQDPENAADTNDMLNMMVQMTTVQAMQTMTDATTMSYTASLVGKEVTVGVYDRNNNLSEIVGTVTATGTYSGQPVVFVDGVSYELSSIMAVGRLPDAKSPTPVQEQTPAALVEESVETSADEAVSEPAGEPAPSDSTADSGSSGESDQSQAG